MDSKLQSRNLSLKLTVAIINVTWLEELWVCDNLFWLKSVYFHKYTIITRKYISNSIRDSMTFSKGIGIFQFLNENDEE